MTERLRNQFLFYLGLPAVIGFLLGANATGIGQFLPWWLSVLFWTLSTLACWLVFHIGTIVAAYLLKPWEPPLIAKLAVGLLFASLPARLMINAFAGVFDDDLIAGRAVQTLPDAELTRDFLVRYAKTWSGPYVVWITANVFFDRIVGFSRYRPKPRHGPDDEAPGTSAVRTLAYPVESDDTDASGEPDHPPSPRDLHTVSALLSRLPLALGFDIVAVKSEDHYLRVYTDRGDTLILYKLSTAIAELEAIGYRGLQVHRSYWVRRDAVTRVDCEGRNPTLTLTIGLTVPVSHTYREIVRQAGLIG